jgi:hypothetical protein
MITAPLWICLGRIEKLSAVVADGFHRAAFLGFLAARFFFGRGRLFADD